MIFTVLICTLIGYLCGSALPGLGVGLVLFGLVIWANYTPSPYSASRRHRRNIRRRVKNRRK